MKPKLHPELARVHPIWKQVKILKEEDRPCYKDFILPWPNESTAGRKEREEIFTSGFLNPSQMLLRTKGDAVFKKAVKREGLTAGQKAFIAQADRSKQSLNEILHNEAAPSLAAFGTIFAVMDKPKVQVFSKEEELQRRRPFLTILDPMQPIDFAYAEDGSLLWFMYRVGAPMDRSDPLDIKRAKGWKGSEGIAIWTQKSYTVKSPSLRETYVEEIENPFGFVPVLIQAQYLEPNKTIGASTFFTSSDYLIMSNNHENAANMEVFKNANSTLTMDVQDWDDDEQPVHEKSPDTNLRMLNKQAHDFKNVFLYHKNKPEFMARNLDLIEKAATRAERYYDLAIDNEKHPLSIQNAEAPQSGVSKSYDFVDINAMLSSFAAAMERFDRQAVNMAALMLDEKDQSQIDYSREFDVRTFNQRLEFIKGLRETGFSSKTGLREAFKTITPEITPDVKLQAVINEEIDSTEPAPLVSNQPPKGV